MSDEGEEIWRLSVHGYLKGHGLCESRDGRAGHSAACVWLTKYDDATRNYALDEAAGAVLRVGASDMSPLLKAARAIDLLKKPATTPRPSHGEP